MKACIIFLFFPSVLLAQISGQGGLVYVNFKPAITGISDEHHYDLVKDPFKRLFSNLKPEVTGISSDFFVSFKPHDHYFIFGQTSDIQISLKKIKEEKPVLSVEKKTETVAVAPPQSTEQLVKPDLQEAKSETPQESGKPDKASENPQQSNLSVSEKSVAAESKPPVEPTTREGSQPNAEVVSNEKELPKPEPLTPERILPRYHALIIGISNYKFSGTGIVNLNRPVLDATKLRETLVNLYHFKPEDVHLMKDASRADIIDGLDELGATLTEKDNLLIFYAGHGFWDENLQIGYWLPSDAISTKKSSWISNSTIKDYIGGFRTKHTLLISDACFSGSIFKVREIETLTDLGTSKLYQLPSRKAMTSGNMKTVPDNSKFFEYLNKRLIENQDLYLSARQLFHNFYVAVINNTNTVPQYGVIQETGDEGGEFIFIKKQ